MQRRPGLALQDAAFFCAFSLTDLFSPRLNNAARMSARAVQNVRQSTSQGGGQLMRSFARIVPVVALAVFAPAIAFAQASITGTVKDTSGAVLPGVTVEASSPALIEKVRTVVSDGTGQYRIVDLRPGTYTVTFTLPGFNTYKRDGG